MICNSFGTRFSLPFHQKLTQFTRDSQRKERYLSCEELGKDLRVWPQICVLLLSLPPTDWAPPARVRGNVVRGERGTGKRGDQDQHGTQAFALSGNSDWRSGTNIKETVGSTSTCCCRAKATTFNWNNSAILLVLGLLKPLHKGKRPQASC